MSIRPGSAQQPVADAQVAPTQGGEFRVWWIPQIPMDAFHYSVADYATGTVLCDALGRYDAFQFENSIKPDYCNMGGVEWKHPVLTEGEWWTLDEDEAEELGFPGAREASTTDGSSDPGRTPKTPPQPTPNPNTRPRMDRDTVLGA